MKKSIELQTVCFLFLVIALPFTIQAQEYLYGLAQKGGMYNMGVPYHIETTGQGFLAYENFDGNNGGNAGNASGFTQYQDQSFSIVSALTQAGDQYLNQGTRVDIKPGQGGIVPPFRFSFSADRTGFNPGGKFLLAANGMFYGMTSTYGEFNGGAMFSKSAIAGQYPEYVVSFDGVNTGRSPKGSLIQGPDGWLFGVTEFGGTQDQGVVFSFNLFTGQFKKLFDFNGVATGSNPTGSLLLASDGKLYGMTRAGGTINQGAVFRINTDGTGFAKLQDLNAASGTYPLGSLIQYTNGVLYGMTSAGGANGFGTIFSLTTSGTFNKVIDFNGTNGKSPVGDLLVAPDGHTMYGVTYSGGANDKGTFFKFENNQLTKLYDFDQSTGSNPVGSLMMMRKYPEMTFLDMPEKTTTSAAFTPEVQVPEGLPVYLASSHPETAIIENNQIKIVGPGNALITAYVAGNHEYLPRFITKFVSVVKTPQTITFPPISPKTYGDAPFTLSATSSAGLPVRITTFSNDVISSDGTKFFIQGAGSITMRAIQEGDATYSSAEVTQELIVNRADQSITFTPSPTSTCCGQIFFNATASSGQDVKFKTADWENLSIQGNVGTIQAIGAADVVAYLDGSRNYKPAEITKTINLLKGNQSIFFSIPNPGTYRFGQSDVFLSSYSSSGLPITYTSDPPGIAVVEGNYLRFIGVGTTTITARQNGNDLMNPAPTVAQTVTVQPPLTPGAGNTITFDNLSTRYVSDAPFNLTAKATSGLSVSYQSSNTNVAEINGNLVTIKASGSTTITARQLGKSGIPAATPVQRVLTVEKQPQYIWLESSYYVNFATSVIPMPSRSSAGLPLTYSSSSPSVAYVDENYFLRLISSGDVTITASHPGNAAYHAANPSSTQVNITPLYQTITFNELPPRIFGDNPFSLSAMTSSGLPVEYTSSNPGVATIDGSTVTIVGAGTTTISARQNGYPGYGYTEVVREFIVNKASQTISFAALPDKNFTDDPFILSAASSTNLPVTFSSVSPSIASVTGNKITIHSTGTLDIIATQAGNQNYQPTEIRQKLKISSTGSSTFDMIGSATFGGANGSGTIFSMKTDGTAFTSLKSFAPRSLPFPSGGFIKGNDGKIYGNFMTGGSQNYGSIVRLEANGTGLTFIHNYNAQTGGSPYGNILHASDGHLYGMTSTGVAGKYGGTIFKVKTDGTSYTILRELTSLDGTSTLGGLTEASNGKLYGMTTAAGFFNYGTIFSIAKDGSDFTVIYRFKETASFRTGFYPRGDLVQGSDGYLYGTLSQGGDNSKGVLFKIQPDGSAFTKLINFDGATYGATPGASILIGSDGKIYGLTQAGGTFNQGTLFAVNTDGSNYTALFNFDGTQTGGNTLCKLTEGSDGLLYGMANAGGTNSLGTVFRISKSGTGFQKLLDFNSSASKPVFGPLVEALPGKFLGMTFSGGAGDGGALFSITSSGSFSIIEDFPQEEANPSRLVGDNTGAFYYGLTQSKRTIFKISDVGEYQSILEIPSDVLVSRLYYMSTGHLWCTGTKNYQPYTFRIKTDGTGFEAIPNLATTRTVEWLTEKSDGTLFGVTSRGTVDQPGTMFTIQSNGTGFATLGLMPSGTEFHGSNYLYGSDGEIYAISTYSHTLYRFNGNAMTPVVTLPADIGQVPMKLIELNGGRIGVAMRNGQIFSVGKDGSQFTTILNQTSELGTSVEDMIQSFDGWIYVAASMGGTYGKGVIYKILSDGSSYTAIHEFNGEDGDSPQSLIFKKLPQIFSFDALDPVNVGAQPFKAVTSNNAHAQVVFTSSDPSIASIEDGKIKPRSKGTTTITASIPANANYYDVAPIQRELVVNKGTQSILFTVPDKVLGDVPFELQATTNAELPISFEILSGNITLNGTKVTLVNAGVARIKATQNGNENFEPAEAVEISFCVNPRKPLITLTGTGSDAALNSSNPTGNQWYINNDIIPDATLSTWQPGETGSYTVITTVEGCTSLASSPFEWAITGLGPDHEIAVNLFPNPVNDVIHIRLKGHTIENTTVELLDALGRVVERRSGNSSEVTLDVARHAKGIYIIKVTSGQVVVIRKILKD